MPLPRLPEPHDDDEEMHHGAWFYVADNDVFPEQFPRFLGLTPAQRDALLAAHGEIFDVRWWQDVQARAAGAAPAPMCRRIRNARVCVPASPA